MAEPLGPLAEETHRVWGSTICDSIRIPTSGWRSRITSAAREPSSVCIGGMRKSTIAESGPRIR
jgi:hypothetical protein